MHECRGGALFDLTASRVAYRLGGSRATDVLATGCPLDLHPRAFRVGDCAQSLFGRVNALLYKSDDAPTFLIMVARSFARDVWQTLRFNRGALHHR
jgi:sarcosine oxidase subunit gamma